MPNFKAIKYDFEPTFYCKDSWSKASKFDSKDSIVDENGKIATDDYNGNRYRLISKMERQFTSLERIGRGLLGVVAVICTLSLGLFLSKSIKDLFTKHKEVIRFGLLQEDTQFTVVDGSIVYSNPKLLFKGSEISHNTKLNFGIIKVKGKEKLVPLTYIQYSDKYKMWAGSALDALLILAQDDKPDFYGSADRLRGSPIGHILKHPLNTSINEEECMKYILDKDESGTPRICSLNSDSTLELLNYFNEKHSPINLHEKIDPNNTLFTLWAGKGKHKMTELMLKMDPSVIEQNQGQLNSPFVKATLCPSKEEAELLLNAMKARKLPLSTEEVWFERALNNDCSFTEQEFLSLSQDLKEKIYFVANSNGNFEIVKKLKPLGMDEKPLFWPGPDILAGNMDMVSVRNTIESFLKNLRKDGCLLTEEEVNKLDPENYFIKQGQIGRIQGKKFIEQIVEEYGLKHIKVPKKIAVLKGGIDTVSFSLSLAGLEIMPCINQMSIYAERIKPVQRKLSLEEAIEFMIVLEKTGYGDNCGDNFFLTEDSIYFIDTEYKDFAPSKISFKMIESIKKLIDLKDVDSFMIEFQKRKENHEKEEGARIAQQREYHSFYEKSPYKYLANGYAEKDCIFNVAELLT